MDLVVDQVHQLEVVHVPNGDRVVEWTPRAAIAQHKFTAAIKASLFEHVADVLLAGAVERTRCKMQAKRLRSHTEVDLEDLSDVHTARYAEWVQHDINRRAIWQEWHIAFRQHAGNNTLVPWRQPSCHPGRSYVSVQHTREQLR